MASTVRIDDLAKPQLPQELRDYMRQAVKDTPINWSVEGVLDAARQKTGLSEFNADAQYEERLALILQSMDEDEDLSDYGRLNNFNMLVRYAVTRLRTEDVIAKNPLILEQEIREPIIIAGLPRSGTTHMLNLISVDERLRHLPYWESLEPVPLLGEECEDRTQDPRRTRCAEALVLQDAIMPYFKNMHEMTADHTHEEVELICSDYSSILFENYAIVPRLRDYYLSHKQTPHYAYMKRVLQVLQWYYPKKRWVLKSPQHMEQLDALVATFPDAYYVLPHRDPLAIVISLATMLSYTGRLSRSRIRPEVFTEYWCDRLKRMLHTMVKQIPLLPKERIIDIVFDDFIADDLAAMERIYAHAHHPMDTKTRDAMRNYIQTHPRGRLGRVSYDLDALGVDVSRMREEYRFYTEQFGVREEY